MQSLICEHRFEEKHATQQYEVTVFRMLRPTTGLERLDYPR